MPGLEIVRVLCLIVCLTICGTAKAAVVETDIYDFPPAVSNGTGIRPGGIVVGSGGVLYGMAGGVGPHTSSNSVIFQLARPAGGGAAWTFTVLHTFPLRVGATSMTLDSSGALYGTTTGPTGGTVFRLTPGAAHAGWTYEDLFSPSYPATGSFPQSAILSGGAIYGVGDCGPTLCAFRLLPPGSGQTGWQAANLYTWPTIDLAPDPNLLVRSVNGAVTLFGEAGGDSQSARPYGAVFQLAASTRLAKTWTLTYLHTFEADQGGQNPTGGLIADRGLNLYGVTGPVYVDNYGVVFRLAPPASGQSTWTYSKLFVFKGPPNKVFPRGPLNDGAGALYAVTTGGGPGCNNYVNGCDATFFRVTPRDFGGHTLPWNETTLLTFAPRSVIFPAHLVLDASNPAALSFYGLGERSDAVTDKLSTFVERLQTTP